MTQDEVDKYCEGIAPNNQATASRRLKYGVGINDLPHIVALVDENGKNRMHSGYRNWDSVLKRCYSEKAQIKRPKYAEVSVYGDWLKASKFVAWQKTQYKEEGWQLDKDLLIVGNKVYSPDTCLYVPQWLNVFTIDSGKARGGCLIGVSWKKQNNKYAAQCNHPEKENQEFLGYFTTESDAHLVWRKRKLEIALELKPKMDEIDTRIYPNVVTIVNNAR